MNTCNNSTLKAPEMGNVTISGYDVGSFASFTCMEGYRLIWSTQQDCMLSGEWSGSSPFCKGIYIVSL